MEKRIVKLYAKNNTVPLKVVPGHFATNHSHVNYYIDMTTLKTRLSEAGSVAASLAGLYMTNTIVDTIVCLDGTQVIGTLLAQELTRAGYLSMNAHGTIYVVTPEYNSNSQMIFRDNIQPMIQGKHVIVLMASVTTGITIRKSMECISYYGGMLVGISAIFSAVDEVEGQPVNAVFHKDDIPDYQSCAMHDCPLCKEGRRIDALVNSFGFALPARLRTQRRTRAVSNTCAAQDIICNRRIKELLHLVGVIRQRKQPHQLCHHSLSRHIKGFQHAQAVFQAVPHIIYAQIAAFVLHLCRNNNGLPFC